MNADEIADAQAISDALGLDIRVQDAESEGEFQLLVIDEIDGILIITSHNDFVERYGTLDEILTGMAEIAAEIEMDAATARDLAGRMLEVVAAFRGHDVAPQSALPDTVNRARHALQEAYLAESEPERERSMMTALVDLEAFIPDEEIPLEGDRVSSEILDMVRDSQAAAVVLISGVHGWRARDGLPARIGEAEPAIRKAVASQAGYNASGVPAMFLGLISVGVVGVASLVVAVVTSTSLLAAAAAAVAAVAGAIAVLGPAGRLASAHAAAAGLDGETPLGQRARRVMRLVEWLPMIGAVGGGLIGLAMGAVILR